ncbi:TPA: DNA cytosine methyltransferase [Klebsiella pneumoniae]
MLTLGSLFDGSGGFPLAAKLSGIKPVWASEIEPFPIRVTTKRIPEMMHVGSITEIHGDELPPVDIITFGSPCQDLSMAGKRDGLNGQKSSLFFEAIRIIKEMREKTNGQYPRFILWENVAGAFSSNEGKDFREVLQQIFNITESGQEHTSIPMPESWDNAGAVLGNSCSVTWRLFDAQFWGVLQRRRRIFLMADFGGGGRFNPVLFEPKGMYGNFGTLQKAWKETSRDFRKGTHCTNRQILIEQHARDSRYKECDTSPCLKASSGTGGNNQPFVVSETVTFSDVHRTISAADYKDPQAFNDNMYVRRLTPLEYCRLQGFPDYWTENLETKNPTEEEMTFWRQVFKTYSEVYETPLKSDKQILNWLKNPFTDSAAYKMWGNGVALPVVFYILNTLNNYVQKENKND